MRRGTRHAHGERALRFLDQFDLDGVRVRPLGEVDDDRPVGRARRGEDESRSRLRLRRARTRFGARGKRHANHQRAIATDALPRRLAGRRHERERRRRERRRRDRRVRTRRTPNAANSKRRIGSRRRRLRRRRLADVAPIVRPRTSNAHLRRAPRISAVLERHGGDLSRDFRLLRDAFFLRRRVCTPRLANLLAVEIPKRDGVPRRARREHLVRHPRVRLEENQTPADRGDVRQTHGLRGGGGGISRSSLLGGSERGDVPHALGDVPRTRGDQRRVVGWIRVVFYDDVVLVRSREASSVAVDEAGGGGVGGVTKATEHAEFAAVALLPLGVEVDEGGEEASVGVGVVHVADVARALAGVDGAHGLGSGGDVASLAAQTAELVDEGVRALHRLGETRPAKARVRLGAAEPPDAVAADVAHGVLRGVAGFAAGEDAGGEVAGVVRGADLVAEIGDGVAREEAVDHHEVLRLEAPGDLGEALVHQPPPLSLAEEGVLGAEVEEKVRVVAVTGRAPVGTSCPDLLPRAPHDDLGGARGVCRAGEGLRDVAVVRRRASRCVAGERRGPSRRRCGERASRRGRHHDC